MKISTKGRYSLRVIVDIAEHSNGNCISLKDISKRQNVSKKYLEQIMPVLTRAGLLDTVRGYQGGYRLAKAADEITVGDILRAAEGSIAPVRCLESENVCDRIGECATYFVWKGLNDAINKYVDSITVKDIIDRENGYSDFCI